MKRSGPHEANPRRGDPLWSPVGQRLRRERDRLNWTQERLAEEVNATVASINRWEHDKTMPQQHYREKLCQVFQKSPEDLFGKLPDAHTGEESEEPELPSTWNVPHLRNLYFTGREQVLTGLHDLFTARKSGGLARITALSGLGGVGKTQCAVEYAYRYGPEYQAVLWVRADSYKSLVSDFIALADLLDLPEKDEADHTHVTTAVKRWLQTHAHWLLILDNADDLEMLYDFLPTHGTGHTLLTTRSQATGPNIKGIELEKMGHAESTLFLLRRAKLIAEDSTLAEVPADDRQEAEAICKLLDGLPLALDQAAAYIEENRCSLAAYLSLYRTRWAALLQRRGLFSKRDYPNSVGTTWSLSFERVAHSATPAAADLLRLCAFLHPDAIPEVMLTAGAAELGPVLQAIRDDLLLLDNVIGELRKYSLVGRNFETKMLTIHRLVQTVLKDIMDRQTQRQWAERTVCLVEHVFPNAKKVENWSLCQQYLPHAQVCTELIEQWDILCPRSARLLSRTGIYLYERGQYAEAELLLQRALSMREHLLVEDDPEVAEACSDLGILYYALGRFELAEPLLQRALSMREQVLGPGHVSLAESLNGLAWIYKTQGKFAQAEPLLRRALSIREHEFGPMHPDVAESFNELGVLYNDQGQFEQAEKLYQRAYSILAQVLPPDHPYVAGSLNNLAVIKLKQGKYEEAEALFRQALARLEQVKGPHHPDVATNLNNLARVYAAQGKCEQAEPLFLRALAIREQTLGANHPQVATSLNDLAKLYSAQGKYSEAEPLFRRTLAIRESILGPQHPEVALTLKDYASLLRSLGQGAQAIELEEHARQISGP